MCTCANKAERERERERVRARERMFDMSQRKIAQNMIRHRIRKLKDVLRATIIVSRVGQLQAMHTALVALQNDEIIDLQIIGLKNRLANCLKYMVFF